MNDILSRAKMLNQEIRRSQEYQEYKKYGAILQENHDLYSRFNEMRMKKYRIQTLQGQNYNEEADALFQEYADLFQDTAVRQFLVAEQRLCTIIRDVLVGITETLNLDLDFLQL